MPDVSKYSDLCDYIWDVMKRVGIPGAAIGVLHDGEIHTSGMGITHIEHPIDVNADTLMQIGSVTKTFTGTVAMMLVEDGKLELDTPIQEIMPDFKLSDNKTAEQVTTRHLLTHVGGWMGDYFDDFGDGDSALTQYVNAVKTMPQITQLGKYWSYNNAAFGIAGRVIEVLSGQTYEDFVAERIFKPLGMDKTFFFERDVMLHRFAVGHHVSADGATVANPWSIARAANAAGRISSTVNDMLKYAQFHLSGGLAADGTRLLSQTAVEQMQESQIEVGGFLDAMGISWMLDDLDGVKVVHHGGATNGQLALLTLIPEQSLAFMLLTNGSDMGRELINGTNTWILREYAGLQTPAPTAIDKAADTLADYIGSYSARLMDVDISRQNNQLVLQATYKGGFPLPSSPAPLEQPPPLHLAFDSDDTVFVTDVGAMKNKQGQFIRNDDGQVFGIRWGARIHTK